MGRCTLYAGSTRLSCHMTASCPSSASASGKNWYPTAAFATATGLLHEAPLFVERTTYTFDCPTRPLPAELYVLLLGTTVAGSTAL
jgi:hypothetical protein